MRKERKKIPVLERLLARSSIPLIGDKPDTTQCWLWRGATNNAGYGMIRVNTELNMILAHRASYIEHYHTIKYNSMKEVLHECGNKLCVNPNHLKIGNIADRHALQAKYNRYNPLFNDKEFMYPTCEHCGETTYLPHFERLHRLCKRNAKHKYITEELSKKLSK